MQCSYTTQLCRVIADSDSAWLFSDIRDDRHDGVDGSINMQVEALEPDLFVLSLQMKR